jgi:hypothetical protein
VPLSKLDVHFIRWANADWKGKEFEYLFTGDKLVPMPEALGDVARHLLTSLQPVIWKAVAMRTRPTEGAEKT